MKPRLVFILISNVTKPSINMNYGPFSQQSFHLKQTSFIPNIRWSVCEVINKNFDRAIGFKPSSTRFSYVEQEDVKGSRKQRKRYKDLAFINNEINNLVMNFGIAFTYNFHFDRFSWPTRLRNYNTNIPWII